ncbi:MAG: hypothetical protein AAB289_15555 [Chloroflexota bacterium]
MFGHRIKIEDELFRKLQQCAAKAGYASTEEFILHALEKEAARILGSGGEGPESEEQLRKRLEGLGYIE